MIRLRRVKLRDIYNKKVVRVDISNDNTILELYVEGSNEIFAIKSDNGEDLEILKDKINARIKNKDNMIIMTLEYLKRKIINKYYIIIRFKDETILTTECNYMMCALYTIKREGDL